MALPCWRECQGAAAQEPLLELHLLPINDLFCSLLGPAEQHLLSPSSLGYQPACKMRDGLGCRHL